MCDFVSITLFGSLIQTFLGQFFQVNFIQDFLDFFGILGDLGCSVARSRTMSFL